MDMKTCRGTEGVNTTAPITTTNIPSFTTIAVLNATTPLFLTPQLRLPPPTPQHHIYQLNHAIITTRT
ncbi:hypothetical protein E2C01_065866 [Portunus trituberculatus]|uniref:Uncharacterized protein n=1 Tax=Portunus trituberculatus TaxID=210409 RepID=A0A5B7HNR0_PORTR|nr:hypothetical protein [Portunus trituberculatus]